MKKRTSVQLSKGAKAPVFFHLVGEVNGHNVRIARPRDWQVFHFPQWKTPVLMLWNTPGHERLFATCIDGELPTHEEALRLIGRWIDMDWTTHRHEYGGAVIPLVAHEKFVIVPESAQLEEEEGSLLVVEPPCLLWHEWHPNEQDGAAIAATIIIR
ncbi:MAG: hypothetical protein PHX93_01065 [Candidatus Peribacteraceae bacterium]|nr:hypothetical protein [Candidatus Peribacteraceae bacterium]